jgi:DnaK suppressor protein
VSQPSQTKPASAVDETSNAALHTDLASARQLLVRATDEHAAMLSDPDTIQEDRDASAQFLAQARAAVARVETALARAEAGSYGWCQSCWSMIPEERLAAIPDTLTCVACA